MGFRRYGFTDEAAGVMREVIGAASYFALDQMPELYAGIPREPMSFPAQYLGANVPQAWAAGAVFSFLQTILGFQPAAARKRLYIDPALPPWLPDLALTNLRVGKQSFDIRLWREGESTRCEVLKGDTDAVAFRSFASGTDLVLDRAGLAAHV